MRGEKIAVSTRSHKARSDKTPNAQGGEVGAALAAIALPRPRRKSMQQQERLSRAVALPNPGNTKAAPKAAFALTR